MILYIVLGLIVVVATALFGREWIGELQYRRRIAARLRALGKEREEIRR